MNTNYIMYLAEKIQELSPTVSVSVVFALKSNSFLLAITTESGHVHTLGMDKLYLIELMAKNGFYPKELNEQLK